MPKKLTGLLNLSQIDKSLIGTTKKNEKCIFIDIIPIKGGQDEYGNTHNITLYNKNTRETTYLGKPKTQEFGGGAAAPGLRDPLPENEDLPFPSRPR